MTQDIPFKILTLITIENRRQLSWRYVKVKKGLIEESYNANFNYLKSHLPEIVKEFEYYLSKSQIFIKLVNFNTKMSKHT